uniref:Replication protein n=1 Tax=uncultured prokaryote TaxID=198431 RepID=A0A0H5PV05_9ZZZZ|nr:hypothetical protein [uncultured prokaryote]
MSKENTTNTLPKDGRVRNITFMLYEDSCNPDWKELLDEEHIPHLWIYHNKDINPTGEAKKPHYHVVLCFDNKKSQKQCQAYADLFGAANGVYKEVQSLRGMARYLCHMDNPEKAQYDSSEVHSCAMDYNSIVGMAQDKYKAIDEMIQFCEEENIISFRELLMYARVHRFDWFKSLCDNSSFIIKEYLKSKVWEMSIREE